MKLCPLERMKPWTKVVKYMTCIVNLRGVSWMENELGNVCYL